jgi:hypothetical protein
MEYFFTKKKQLHLIFTYKIRIFFALNFRQTKSAINFNTKHFLIPKPLKI